jgi:hypothetical protein
MDQDSAAGECLHAQPEAPFHDPFLDELDYLFSLDNGDIVPPLETSHHTAVSPWLLPEALASMGSVSPPPVDGEQEEGRDQEPTNDPPANPLSCSTCYR